MMNVLLLLLFCFSILTTHAAQQHSVRSTDYITIAILAKDKAQCLDLYLSCLEKQTWPKSQTYLYIRTNNNTDETAEILRSWITRIADDYADIYFDETDVPEPVQDFTQHEWNNMRLRVLCAIRQQSVDWARKHNSHYFIADCDNFIYPNTIETLFNTNLPIIAPLLRCSDIAGSNPFYSNYHYAIDENGYYSHSPFYYNVLYQEIKGIIEVPVVHCTYLMRREILDTIYYEDYSGRYDYVILCDSARKNQIPQYLDNRKIYGYLTFTESKQDFSKEPFIATFQ
jgi:hypothetical protein